MGSFGIHLYGVIIGMGILAGFWFASRMARKFALYPKPSTLNPTVVWGSLWWVVIPAVIGARLYHVLDFRDYYLENLVLIPAIWTGGMGIFGGIVGGSFGLWLFARNSGIRFRELADLAAFGLPVGQAIGRWGNFFNQELYGKPTDLPWGLAIPLEKRLSGFEQYSHFHPLFLYESLWNLMTFGLLLYIFRTKVAVLKPGSYLTLYLVLYGIGRFFLEGLRIEPWVVGGVIVARFFSVLMVLLGGGYLYSIVVNKSYKS